MDTWYFETSAVNHFANEHTVEEALATKRLQLHKGRDWRISPVTIWEVLMTSDSDERDRIIRYCQHLFSRELLPNPSELIVPYIEKGMPQYEPDFENNSTSRLADTWRSVVDDRRQSISFDHQELKARISATQELTKDLYKVIKSQEVVIRSSDSHAGLDYTLHNLVNELPFVKSGEPVSSEQRLHYRVALHFIIVILCAEVDFENGPIKEFWKKRKIDSTADRIYYVVTKLPELVYRGPFILMAYMAVAQAQKKYSRGLWHDCLHCVYLPYVSYLFTTDEHFDVLRRNLPLPLALKVQNFSKIRTVKQPLGIFGVENT